jgi:hypothetical protein
MFFGLPSKCAFVLVGYYVTLSIRYSHARVKCTYSIFPRPISDISD